MQTNINIYVPSVDVFDLSHFLLDPIKALSFLKEEQAIMLVFGLSAGKSTAVATTCP